MPEASPYLLRFFGSPRIEGPMGVLSGPASQRHRLALLALLATAPRARLPRDKLLGLLWPETEMGNARHLLNAAVHAIRKALGEDALVTEGEALRLDTDSMRIDALAFETAQKQGDAARAVDLYAGPFLDGLSLPDAVEFEQWQERERDRLERLYYAALEQLAEGAATQGDLPEAVRWWRRRLSSTPTDERVALRLMKALSAAGDRAGALQLASAHAALLQSELGAQPDPQIEKLAKELRQTRQIPEEGKRGREEVVASVVKAPEVTVQAAPLPVPARWRSRRLVIPMTVAVLALVALAAIVSSDRGNEASADRVVNSVAVLPFVDNSPGQDQEHFASGIAESILNALANVPGLSVPARSSSFQFRGDSLDLRDVAQRLAVDAVLEGSVQIVGNRLRITVRLAHAGSGYQLFSKQYDRTSADIFAVQDQIAEAIVDELRLQLNNGADQRMFRTEKVDLAAYELYLRGLQTANTRTREGMQNAVRYFEEAIHIDSTFAAAHAGLADAYVALSDHGLIEQNVALARARSAVARALKLDSASAEAYIAQGHIWNEPGRWDQAEQMFRRAIQLRPSYAAAHMWLANNLMVRGRTAEGLQEFLRASELDPLSPSIITGLSQALSVSGDQEGAIRAARRAIDLNPRYPWSHQTLAVALAAQGRFDEALAEATEAVALSEQHPNTLAVLAAVHALAQQQQKAREILTRLHAARPAPAVPAAEALVHASLGEVNTAFELLNGLKDLNAATREWIRVNPVWQPLRADPRWPELLRNLGLEG
ncbi:MAG: BTAD domain-containing putative transcriptional regulator [Longimicrobiales bacterium]